MTIFLARHRIRLMEGHKYSMVDHTRMEMRNLCKNIVVNVVLYRYHSLDNIERTFLAVKSFKRECVHILFWTISSVQIFRSLTIQYHRMNGLGLLWGVLIPFLCQSVHFLITFKSPKHVPQSHWVKTESSTTSLVAFPYQFRCYGDGVKRSNVRKSVVHWEPKVMNPLGWLCFLRGILYRTRQGYLPLSAVQGLLLYTPNPALRFKNNPSVYQTSVEKGEVDLTFFYKFCDSTTTKKCLVET